MPSSLVTSHGRHPTSTALLKIASFCGLFISLLYLTDAMIGAGLRRIKTSAFGVNNQIMGGQVNADIIISGSSRALTHYDPRIIQEQTGHSAFNIGRNGSQTDMQLAFLKAYLNYNRAPRLVIHNLDLFSFVSSKEIYDAVQYIPYIRDDAIFAGIQRVYPDAWKWKWLPLYGYLVEDMRFTWVRGLRALTGWQPPEDHFFGYQPRHIAWTNEFDEFRIKNPDGVRFPIEPAAVQDLTDLVELCSQHGIALLFVYSPEYAEMQTLERNREEIFSRLHALCARYNVPLWDYSDSPLTKNQMYFYNSQHLNATGASAFSRALAERLDASGLLP